MDVPIVDCPNPGSSVELAHGCLAVCNGQPQP